MENKQCPMCVAWQKLADSQLEILQSNHEIAEKTIQYLKKYRKYILLLILGTFLIGIAIGVQVGEYYTKKEQTSIKQTSWNQQMTSEFELKSQNRE